MNLVDKIKNIPAKIKESSENRFEKQVRKAAEDVSFIGMPSEIDDKFPILEEYNLKAVEIINNKLKQTKYKKQNYFF